MHSIFGGVVHLLGDSSYKGPVTNRARSGSFWIDSLECSLRRQKEAIEGRSRKDPVSRNRSEPFHKPSKNYGSMSLLGLTPWNDHYDDGWGYWKKEQKGFSFKEQVQAEPMPIIVSAAIYFLPQHKVELLLAQPLIALYSLDYPTEIALELCICRLVFAAPKFWFWD